jgi:hypothetical protein
MPASLLKQAGQTETANDEMKYNHAANDSPRSGSSKRTTPLAWAAIIVTIIAIAIWLGLKA